MLILSQKRRIKFSEVLLRYLLKSLEYSGHMDWYLCLWILHTHTYTHILTHAEPNEICILLRLNFIFLFMCMCDCTHMHVMPKEAKRNHHLELQAAVRHLPWVMRPSLGPWKNSECSWLNHLPSSKRALKDYSTRVCLLASDLLWKPSWPWTHKNPSASPWVLGL